MNKFQASAKRNQTASIMTDREKITTNDLIAKYPQGITITEFALLSSNNGPYAVVLFAEDTTKFYNCGTALYNICVGWAEDYQGDVLQANKDLKEAGGAKFKLSWGTNKGGRATVQIEAVEA